MGKFSDFPKEVIREVFRGIRELFSANRELTALNSELE
jgi:hypothetical protein